MRKISCEAVFVLVKVIILIRHSGLVVGKDVLCDAAHTVPTGQCCPRSYARFCCSSIALCADGRNDTVQYVNLQTACRTPWNLTACKGGFYSPDGLKTLSCPSGFFCEANSVCLKPCPAGGYCVQNKLQNGNCTKFRKCCMPSNVAPIFDNTIQEFLCPGEFYPKRCTGGYYCPNSTTMLSCPAGHFCREGSDKAIKCPGFSNCGEGETAANTLYAGLAFNAILLVIFIIIILAFVNQHVLKFYAGLYIRRATRTERPSQRFNITDGVRLAINRLGKLDDDDDVEFQPKTITYNISFERLSLRLTSGAHKGKAILQGVTGEVRAGEVTAVLGPSGSGKTTFMNVLCGKAFYGETGGTVKINGYKVTSFEKYKSLLGFVPQDDIMLRTLTVFEVLYYNALLRLPPQSDSHYYKKIVQKILELLGIKHISNTQIGDEETRGISGGQRRRVNIGMELVADPSVLFLDEPTTGLDSSSSFTVLNALNTIASEKHITIMCTIHQPRYEILKMFDKVLFLGPGGRTVYSGTVENAEPYFASIGFPLPAYMNPADFYLDVISGTVKHETNSYFDLYQEWEKYQGRAEKLMQVEEPEVPDRVKAVKPAGGIPAEPEAQVWMQNTAQLLFLRKTSVGSVGNDNPAASGLPSTSPSPSSANPAAASTSPSDQSSASPPAAGQQCESSKVDYFGPGFLAQLRIFTQREFVLQLRMAKTILLDQALTLFAGALLGLLFREVVVNDIQETAVLADIVAGLAAVAAASRRFGQNRVVFWRESSVGINRLSYFLAVNLSDIPTLLISPAVFLSVYYNLAAYLAPFHLHYVLFLCAWFWLSGLGYTLSLIMTQRNAQICAGVLIVILCMLSGGVPTLCELDDTVIVTAIYNLSFSRWVVEGIFEIEAHERSEVLSDIISTYKVASHYDLDTYNTSIIALISMGFGLRIIALLLLLFTKRGQQK